MEWVFIATIGAVFGSFCNVLILRIPNNENIAFPASHCPVCQTPLKSYHNIPIFSWLFLRGKCAFCHVKISILYPIIELLTLAIFLITFMKVGIGIDALVMSILFTLLLVLSMIDLKYKAVPDSLNLFTLTLSLFAFYSPQNLLINLQNALLFAGAFTLLRFFVSFYMSMKLSHKRGTAPWLRRYPLFIEAMGEADIMIAATLAAMLGLQLAFIAIFLAALITIPASLYAQRFDDARVPFIPFLALGAWIAFLFDAPLYALISW